MPNQILSIAVNAPLRRLFDYLVPQDVDPQRLVPGIRLRVPFRSGERIGILIEVKTKTRVNAKKLKRVYEVLDAEPALSADIFYLCQWAASYYHAPLGEVLMNALPKVLRLGKNIKQKDNIESASSHAEAPLNLSVEQANALQQIRTCKNIFKVFLLAGVTGSGKTEIYLQAIDDILKEGKQALVLIPEISLTPQTIMRFQARFSVPVAALHSGLTDSERAQSWQAAKTNTAKIVIGTRSAVFTPFKTLGIIIVDEEHDPSFKQQEKFRYHARDLAIMRAQYNNVPILLGSATPSLESYLNAQRSRYELITLSQRAGNAELPSYELIDLSKHYHIGGLSEPTLHAIKNHLQAGNQVLIFLNRRGFAPVLYCTSCHQTSQCKRCDARLVYHAQPLHLRCHYCETNSPIPKYCVTCNAGALEPIGAGTQRLEKRLSELFAAVPIIRIDRDNTRRKGAMYNLLEQMHQTSSAILLGTQMIAKGHHFPNVTLTCIIDVDAALLSTDFRAVEQISQLLIQVGGRAGRAQKPGQVLIQTRNPQNSLLQVLIQQGYPAFADALLQQRAQANLPPFAFYALFKAEAYTELKVTKFFSILEKLAAANSAPTIHIYGPYAPVIAKKKGLHCKYLLAKSSQRKALQHFLNAVIMQLGQVKSQPAKWTLDVDPVTF